MTIDRMKNGGARCAWRAAGAVLVLHSLAGCTAESVRVAIETQRRVDSIHQAVAERQHEGLCVLLYRDLVQKLGDAGGEPLNEGQKAALNAAWNDRDLIEFWMMQHERATALRRLGVDAKLYSDQSIVDLVAKAIDAGAARLERALEQANGAEQQHR